MLKESKIALKGRFFECLGEGEPWNLNIFLDDDQDPSRLWPFNYDADIDLLFGKYGLPEDVWRGKAIFDDLEQSPEPIQVQFEQVLEQEEHRA